MVKVVTVPIIQYQMFCDFCHEQIHGRNPCYGCRKDICHKCSKLILHRDPFSGDDTGDYPPCVCFGCKQLLDPFIESAAKVRETAEVALEAMEAEFRSGEKK